MTLSAVDWRGRLLRAVVLVATLSHAVALITSLDVSGDSRAIIEMEPFGFDKGGHVRLEISNWKCVGLRIDGRSGFVLRKVESKTEAITTVETAREDSSVCLLDDLAQTDVGLVFTGKSEDGFESDITAPGLYLFVHVVCGSPGALVTFSMSSKMYNPGPSYLSSGDAPLPMLYTVLSLNFGAGFLVWLLYLRRHAEKVQHVHRMMTVLVLLKSLSLLSEGVMYHSLDVNGHNIGWNVVYYVFYFVRGVMLFVVILLIGTGWSLLKPVLSDREKRVVMLVLPLQVLDNIAYVVMKETDSGSASLVTWHNLFILIDIACCVAIVLPIVWSIRALGAASGTDGKAADNLARLTQFRSFYISVVGYVYFSRIVVSIISGSVGYSAEWLGPAFEETAALMFYSYTAFVFRPTAENPYLTVTEDSDVEDFGLADTDDGDGDAGRGGVEMVRRDVESDGGDSARQSASAPV